MPRYRTGRVRVGLPVLLAIFCLALSVAHAADAGAATRFTATGTNNNYGSSGTSQYVLGYLFKANGIPGNPSANYVDVQATGVDASGELFGYGRVSTNSKFGSWGGSRCAWIDIGTNSGMTAGGTVSGTCPMPAPNNSGVLDPSVLFQAGTWVSGCGAGCVQPAIIQPGCTDFNVYANYDPATHAFSNPSGVESVGRGSPGYPGVNPPGVAGFGSRYRTADGYAVMMKDSSRSPNPPPTPWGFMKSDCLAGTQIQAWPSEARGGGPTSGAGIASWGPGRLDTFYRDSGLALHHDWYDSGQWLGSESLGGVLASDPDAVSWSSGRVDAVATGTDANIYHWWYNGAWGFEALPGGESVVGAPAVASWAPGRLDVFALNASGNLIHQWTGAGTWSGWENLGGSYVSAPAATSWGNGRLDIVIRKNASTLTHLWYNGGWGSEDIAGPAGGMTWDPAIATWGANHLDVFVASPDHTIRQKVFDLAAYGGWGPWSWGGGYTTSSPAAVSWGTTRVDMMWVDAPGQNTHAWTTW